MNRIAWIGPVVGLLVGAGGVIAISAFVSASDAVGDDDRGGGRDGNDS